MKLVNTPPDSIVDENDPLLIDTYENRFQIPDCRILDKKSQTLLELMF